MNLSMEVRDGILNHTGSVLPFTLEGQVVKISDRIAYINHDIDDALRSGVISETDLPDDCIAYLGNSHKARIDTLVRDMIKTSDGRDRACLSEDAGYYMNKLRAYMFKKVYQNENVKQAEDLENVENTICGLYNHLMEDFSELPRELSAMRDVSSREELVKDHIASMTDRYAINTYKRLCGKK